MILKYLLIGIIIYGIYRFTIKGSLNAGESDPSIHKAQEDDDYIDYEEIE